MISIALVFLTLSGFSMPSSAEIKTFGVRSCGVWVEENKKGGVAEILQMNWLSGVLTGMAIGLDINILINTDGPSSVLWVNNYCRVNPLKNSLDAAKELVLELNKGSLTK